MNQNGKKKVWNIGNIKLEDISFLEDDIEIIIDICELSDTLKEEVDKAISAEKENYLLRREEIHKEFFLNRNSKS